MDQDKRETPDPTPDEVAEEVVGVAEDPTTPQDDAAEAPSATDDRPQRGPAQAAADHATAAEGGGAGAPEDDGEASEASEPAEPAEPAEPDWQALVDRDPRSPAELLAELTEAEARRDEYLEDVRRARAEFENYRKRTMKEATAQRDHGRAEVASKLLDVLDDFDRTLDAAQGSADETLAKGVEMVYGKLVTVLRDLGLRRIDETGVTFDPNRHEAVQEVPADEPVDDPVVAQVFRPGYELDGRVLRAAMVVVEQ